MLANFYLENTLEAGLDEAGRGCLAGPVVAAAVILPPNISIPELNDSKKLSDKKRKELREQIKEVAVAWAVAEVSAEEVDDINILNASFLAMHKAISKLSVRPEMLIIDGNRFKKYLNIPHKCFVKGDGRFMSIAAASILAKTHRDDLMDSLSLEHPEYDWKKNKGYPTEFHREAIRIHGISPYHRRSFKLLPVQYTLDFGE